MAITISVAIMLQASVQAADAREVSSRLSDVDVGSSIDPPPDSDGTAHGNGVDLVAGYTTGSNGVKSGDKQRGDGSSGGSGTSAAPTVGTAPGLVDS